MARKSLVEIMNENKKILRREYEKGFEKGGEDMNEKWLSTKNKLKKNGRG